MRVPQASELPEPQIREGFNDGSEVGAGEKLLLLLQRWDVQNVVLIISIWEDGLPNTLTGERFKVRPWWRWRRVLRAELVALVVLQCLRVLLCHGAVVCSW